MSVFDPSLPLERARTIPNSWYFDASIAATEAERIFSRSWICVGFAEHVDKPGDYLTFEIAGEPLLVVRGDDGKLRGFFNVCRHRAAPLLTDAQGCVNKLRCRYHGWTYDLAGRLKGTPEFEGVCEFEKDDNGLVPIAAVETWGAFVFATIEGPGDSLTGTLDPLPNWAAKRLPFEGLTHRRRVSYEIACDWKVYVDNYLDGGYHVNTVHPALAGVLDYREYTTTAHGRTVLQTSPIKPADGDAGRTRIGTEAAYWWIWPNLMINFYSGIMDVNRVIPTGPGRCRVIFDYWFRPETNDSFIEESIAVADRVQMEDGEICEQVQRNLSSRSYKVGRFSAKRENGGYHFHRLLHAALKG